MSESAHTFLAGDVIDSRYRLVRPLGAGGMGEVWEAHHQGLDRLVALKLVRVGGEMRARLLVEARLLASLHHPAIVAVHDAGVTDQGVGYLAMDVLVGETLASRLVRAPLAVREAVELFVELLAGLEAAHAAGIIHRDIKPDNVLLVSRAGATSPILIDFGIAVPVTADGQAVLRAGTPVYMAPEQLLGTASSERTDVWATCVSLYETITGRVPFDGPDIVTTSQRILEAPLAFPTSVPGFDGKLWAVLTRGLRKDPAERIPTARELKQALGEWLGRPATPAPERTSATPRSRVPSEFEVLIRKKLTEG